MNFFISSISSLFYLSIFINRYSCNKKYKRPCLTTKFPKISRKFKKKGNGKKIVIQIFHTDLRTVFKVRWVVRADVGNLSAFTKK